MIKVILQVVLQLHDDRTNTILVGEIIKKVVKNNFLFAYFFT